MKDDDQRERLAHGAARRRAVRARLQHRCSRRSCRTRPTRSGPALGGEGEFTPMPRIEEVEPTSDGAGCRLPDHHRRLLRDAARWEPAPGGGRHAGRQADADLHQARPVGRRRGARPAGRVVRVPEVRRRRLRAPRDGRSSPRLARPPRGASRRRAARAALRRPAQLRPRSRRSALLGRHGRRRRLHRRQDAVRRPHRARPPTSGWPVCATSCSARSSWSGSGSTDVSRRRLVHRWSRGILVRRAGAAPAAWPSTVDGGIDAFVQVGRHRAAARPARQRGRARPCSRRRGTPTDRCSRRTPVPVAEAARAYVESIEGAATGQVIRVGH